MDPALHRELAAGAARRRISLNRLCAEFLQQGLSRKAETPWWRAESAAIVGSLRQRFGTKLVGVAIFGSQVRGEATENSDVDFLIVLDEREPVQRSLYAWWDDHVRWEGPAEASPQFVHLPSSADVGGGLWLEAAMASEVLWERGRALSSMLAALRKKIESGDVRRFWSNGQPYWVRRDDAEQGSGS